MEQQYIWQLIILAILIGFSAFFSSAETALTSVSKLHFRHLAKQNIPNADKVLKLLNEPNRLLGAILVGNNIVNIGASALATSLAMNVFGSAGVGIATGSMTLLVLIFGEITPKSWAVRNAVKFSLSISGIIRFLIIITHPIVVFLLFITNFLIRLTGGDAENKDGIITQEELRSMVDFSHEEGVLEGDERKMIHNVLQFGDLPIRTVMTPRTDMVAISETASLEDLGEVFRNERYSKIPVYSENIDNITGIINVKNFVFSTVDGPPRSLLDFKTPAFFTYEFMRVTELFQEFRKKRLSLAIVLDEYGGTVGVVTMEDLIEEIFGELEDSASQEGTEFIVPVDDGYIVGGSTRIDDINDQLGLRIHGEEFDSIAGFIIFELGYLPKQSETLYYNDHTFTILELVGKRITKVRIAKTPPKLPHLI